MKCTALIMRWLRKVKTCILPEPVKCGWLAFCFLLLAVLVTGLESAYVQVITTYKFFSPDLLTQRSFLFLLCLDLLVPLTIALLSRRVFMVFLLLDCFLNSILLHYTIFFYNPLTLSTIYHSMQGAASLGVDIFVFARWDIIGALAVLLLFKIHLVSLSRLPDASMPKLWNLRGVTAISCMAVIWLLSTIIYGQTGLSVLWVESQGHRTASERRLEAGTREAVRTIGYVATWIGEWRSGIYRDTTLIYQEMRCLDPDVWPDDPATRQTRITPHDGIWNGLPVPPRGGPVVFVQVESLDFSALSMKVNGHTVTPFLDFLARESVVLKVFAPHKVGSSNSDYELLNGRIADQNVLYYTYIKEYPDSIIHSLVSKGYHPTVMHGLSGSLFNLRDAYAAQGFEHFFFKEELEREGYAPSPFVMKHIVDGDVFGKASELFAAEQKPAQFIISMTSHIPFITPLPIFKSAGGVFARYVSSLRYLDQTLAAYYAQLPQGTLVVVWGDHGSDVPCPQGFPENDRHVPFIVHVKGEHEWMRVLNKGNQEERSPGGVSASADNLFRYLNLDEEMPKLASKRIYTLCELYYYLRRMCEE